MRLLIILLAILPLSLSAKAPLMSALVQVKSAPALALPDLSGKLVFNVHVRDNNIRLSESREVMHLVKINTANGSIVRKVVLTR